MALRNILTVEEPVLHKTARPVTRFDAHLGELLDDMRQTLTNAGGVGLAAPQIGILRRVVVVDDDGELIELVNPEILETSGEQDGMEGCLTPEQLRQGLTFQPIPVQLAVYAIFLSTDGLLMFLFTLLMNRYQNRLSGREWALYLAFPASQYLLIYGWVIFLRTDFILRRVLMLLLALAICTAADALLFTAIRGMAQRSELKARNDLLARQIDRQNEHYAALTAQYENLRRIRHDISSHLYTMQLLLQEGQYDEAAAYSAEVTEACRFRSDLGACENPVVDAVLFSRTEELRAQGYTLQLQVCIPAETGIRNADMVVAFGNLLDNAAEACRDAGEKRLSLSARMDRGFLCIEVRNPAPAAPARHSRRIPELERGIGSHILRALAETYEGSYALTPSGGECTASLLLKGAAA